VAWLLALVEELQPQCQARCCHGKQCSDQLAANRDCKNVQLSRHCPTQNTHNPCHSIAAALLLLLLLLQCM
jgi:hypothetical protein